MSRDGKHLYSGLQSRELQSVSMHPHQLWHLETVVQKKKNNHTKHLICHLWRWPKQLPKLKSSSSVEDAMGESLCSHMCMEVVVGIITFSYKCSRLLLLEVILVIKLISFKADYPRNVISWNLTACWFHGQIGSNTVHWNSCNWRASVTHRFKSALAQLSRGLI